MAQEVNMTELEKLEAGLEYCFAGQEFSDRKLRARKGCAKLNLSLIHI